ncbi:hypothetical protein KKH96_03205 [Patescibacteria group bacterium]|nr:hypothetical protein [Patescibacteria group bacterium]
MTSKELMKEYFKGGNAINIPYSVIKEALEQIKEIGDKLDKEREANNQSGGVYPQSEKPNPGR